MIVKELIESLSQIEDKDQNVYNDAFDVIDEVIEQDIGVVLF